MEELYKNMEEFEKVKLEVRRQELHIEHLEDESKEYEEDKEVYKEYLNSIKKEKEELKEKNLKYKKFASDANIKKVTQLIMEIKKEKKQKELELKKMEHELQGVEIEYQEFLTEPTKGMYANDFLMKQKRIEIDINAKKEEIKELDSKMQQCNEFLLKLKGMELTVQERKEINKEEIKEEVDKKDKVESQDEHSETSNDEQKQTYTKNIDQEETQTQINEGKTNKIANTEEKLEEKSEEKTEEKPEGIKQQIKDYKFQIVLGKELEIYKKDGTRISIPIEEYKEALKEKNSSLRDRLVDLYKEKDLDKENLQKRFDKIVDKINPAILLSLEKMNEPKLVWDYINAIEDKKAPEEYNIIYNENSYKKRTILDRIKALPFINKALNRKEIKKLSNYADQDKDYIATVIPKGKNEKFPVENEEKETVNERASFIEKLQGYKMSELPGEKSLIEKLQGYKMPELPEEKETNNNSEQDKDSER